MSAIEDEATLLADLIRRRFDPLPVPGYPPLLGLDPLGREDEYSAFAGVAWPDVPTRCYQWVGYDISPGIGFRVCPRMWSYYFPGFMTSALMHEGEYEVMDGLLWQLRDLSPPTEVRPSAPWWGGEAIFANYSRGQADCVIRFLQFVRAHGSGEPFHYAWEAPDDRALRRWSAARG